MKIINDLNFKKQAKELGISIWKTPSFLFLLMGIIIIVAMTGVYYVSNFYNSPEVLVIAESVVIITIFSIGNSIISEVERIARLNKMKSEFVSVASHQLRTPLSAIRWETELLLSKFGKGLNEKQKNGIESINLLANRMTRLVGDLLDVARIDQGRLILKKSCFNIEAIVQKNVDELMSMAKAKNINLLFKSGSSPVFIVGDEEKLELAIENLISNAIKYTLGQGKVEISIHKKNGLVVFICKDNGVGIPEEQQPNVFSKFFRSDNVVKYQTEGTGLGLYIAKNIVEQSGGKIWFQSIEGVGSIFNFSLPMCSTAQAKRFVANSKNKIDSKK
ncbi:MAG TPA: HAMP domain-containing sensor histidine kinase [Patescibacteria group bacterium]